MSRIAIVTPEYPDMRRPSFGGIAAQYGVMAAALAELGDEVHVLVPGADGDEAFERNGVVVHGVAVRGRTGPAYALARCAATRRAAGHLGRFDTILVADWSGNGALLSAAAGQALITHLHTSLAMMLQLAAAAGEGQQRPGFRGRLQLAGVARGRALGCDRRMQSSDPRSGPKGLEDRVNPEGSPAECDQS